MMRLPITIIFALMVGMGLSVSERQRVRPIERDFVEIDKNIESVLRLQPTMGEFISLVTGLLEKGEPIDKISQLIDKLIAELGSEQTKHDEIKQGQDEECKKELTFRRQELGDATMNLDKASESKGRCEAQLTKAEATLAVNSQVQKSKNGELDSLKAIRETQRKLFQTRQKAYKQATDIISSALEMVEQLASDSAAFVEISSERGANLAKTSAQLLEAVSHVQRDSQLINPVANVLAQVCADPKRVKPADVARLKDLLNRLKKSLESTFQAQEKAENDAIARYQKATIGVDGVVNELTSQEQALRAAVADLNTCIGDETAIISKASIRKRRHANLQLDLERLCKVQDAQYNAASKARRDTKDLYRKLLEWLKEYVNSKRGKQ